MDYMGKSQAPPSNALKTHFLRTLTKAIAASDQLIQSQSYTYFVQVILNLVDEKKNLTSD